jgi:hypothetical protein
MPEQYPWYALAEDADIEQGDIFFKAPHFVPPVNIDLSGGESVPFKWSTTTVIVLNQTCDLVAGREKVADVLLAPVWPKDRMHGHLATEKGLEEARRGYIPGYHMLNRCDFPECAFDVSLVEFGRLSTLSLAFLRSFAAEQPARVRLLPPYREHLAQAFARFFMRIGLPQGIASFR